jgi:hypothetical protein
MMFTPYGGVTWCSGSPRVHCVARVWCVVTMKRTMFNALKWDFSFAQLLRITDACMVCNTRYTLNCIHTPYYFNNVQASDPQASHTTTIHTNTTTRSTCTQIIVTLPQLTHHSWQAAKERGWYSC